MKAEAQASLDRLDEITRRLRRECPWDREQDARSIVPHTVEEAYELADAARSGDSEAMLDELGDVLFQVVFLALLLEERGEGDLGAVAESCTAKLIRRHPHVFGDRDLRTAGEVLGQWERIKREEEEGGSATTERVAPGGAPSHQEGVPQNLPALTYARKLLRRIDPEGSATTKRVAPGGAPSHQKPGGPGADDETRAEAEREVGELLLAAVRRSRDLGVDPELALRAAARRLAASD